MERLLNGIKRGIHSRQPLEIIYVYRTDSYIKQTRRKQLFPEILVLFSQLLKTKWVTFFCGKDHLRGSRL